MSTVLLIVGTAVLSAAIVIGFAMISEDFRRYIYVTR